MRQCIRCNEEMIENCDLRAGSNDKITLTKSTKIFFPEVAGFIKVAVCPKCGEISLYIDPDKITK
ncbi:MAG: nucleic acid-binding protein [bacterium]